MIFWGDLDARARGLATRLRSRSDLEALAAAPDPSTLARGLAAGRRPPAGEAGPVDPADVDRALRRERAARLALLTRWAGPRAAALSVLFEDEDRRSVRALLRGAARGAPPAERLEGLVPTPTLPDGALERMADRENLEGVVRALDASGHPWGEGLARAVAEAPFDLVTLEIAIDGIFFPRALRATRRGGRVLRAHVRDLIDRENAWTALLWDGPAAGAAVAWIDGGPRLPRSAFDTTLAAGDPGTRRSILAASLRGTPVGRALDDPAVPLSGLEAAELAARIDRERRAARLDPLGPAPLLVYALRLRAEATDLRRIAWGVAMGAPTGLVVQELTVER